MISRNLRGLLLFTLLLLIIFWSIIINAAQIDAETNITPTLIVTNRNYLPYIRGLVAGPTATATLPWPTMTPYATNTNTPTATATETITPTSTATSTPTPTATVTLPPTLAAPTLDDIDNGDQDGNFTVSWSAVDGADFYQVMQNHDDAGFAEIYKGPELSIDRTNLAPGNYCYNVRARGSDEWSDWAGEKCTTVVGKPEPEYVCEFETIYEGPREGSDIELLHDGRVFITQTSEDSASIFDPSTRNFERVALPQGGGRYAAVLGDGNILLTVEGTDPHSMIYDPVTNETTRLDSIVECLGVYSIFPYSHQRLITYCGDDHGYVYDDINRSDLSPHEYWLDIEGHGYSGNRAYIIFRNEFRGSHYFQITNGIASATMEVGVIGYAPWSDFDHWGEYYIDYGSASALSTDNNKIYISGGAPGDCGGGTGGGTTTVDSYVSNIASGFTFEQTAAMWQARQGHTMIGLFDGTVISLGGDAGDYYCEGEHFLRDVELYVPSSNKWYKAGSLNIARSYRQQAIQLINGEIFVYGGISEPGPGYGYEAPTEIGRCELK